jgi:hypothetical protein
MNDIISDKFRNRIIAIYGFLAAVNIGAWIWAIIALHDNRMKENSLAHRRAEVLRFGTPAAAPQANVRGYGASLDAD